MKEYPVGVYLKIRIEELFNQVITLPVGRRYLKIENIQMLSQIPIVVGDSEFTGSVVGILEIREDGSWQDSGVLLR